MTPIPFIGPAYRARSDNYANSRCINLYLEPGKGKAPGLLIGSPGLTAPWVTISGAGGMRGMYKVSDTNAVMVRGSSVYNVTAAGAATLIGLVPDDARPVQITGNRQDIVITSAGDMHALTLAGTASTKLSSSVGMVDFLDDHFVATEEGTNNFIWSDVVSTNFDPLNIQATNGAPDTMVGVKVSRRTMYLFGTNSLEQWFSDGGQDIPFRRIDGAFFEIGCIAKDSIAELDTVFWLGGHESGAGSVWTMSGGAPRRVSTPAVEFAIGKWPDMSDAEAFTYHQEGHSFYCLSSVSGNETWVYDISTDEWHQRAWLHPSGELHRIRPRCHIFFAGKNLVGDRENGNVYAYDLDTYTDNGTALVALRSCQTIQNGLEMQRNASLQLDMDTGVGLATGQGEDPQAMLRYSRDGGKTWSSELWRSFGKIGEYEKRCVWRRVGGGRRMVFEVRITDPVKRNITGAYIV